MLQKDKSAEKLFSIVFYFNTEASLISAQFEFLHLAISHVTLHV